MMTDAEIQELKEENARLMQDKARAEAIWHEEVRAKLTKLDTELQTIKLNTTELPQIRANQQSQADRIRSLEDRWIIIVATWVITVIGFILYVKWKLP